MRRSSCAVSGSLEVKRRFLADPGRSLEMEVRHRRQFSMVVFKYFRTDGRLLWEEAPRGKELIEELVYDM